MQFEMKKEFNPKTFPSGKIIAKETNRKQALKCKGNNLLKQFNNKPVLI